jgi:MarR family transcriptional regulator, lower aerobic nicotinate degradation pathway regulator
MPYDFIKQLIDKVQTYETTVSDNKPMDINDFAKWILADASTASNGIEASAKPFYTEGTSRVNQEENNQNKRNGGVGALIGLMYRYARNYAKKALHNTPLQTLEEFTYMATLMQYPMTKTQIITQHVHEKTTGMAVIQRLVKQNWVKQSNNTADGRSQIIELTDEGRIILRGAFLEMYKVSAIVTANLTAEEKTELTRILEKLDLLHRHILETEKVLDLDKIVAQYT